MHPASSILQQIAVLVPAWQPDGRLLQLAEALAAQGFGAVVVVDDGSSAACEPVFNAVAAIPGVHLLRHTVNLGKGRALKTGIDYVLNELRAMAGLVTADADGQHIVTDIVRVTEALDLVAGAAVLGVRRLPSDAPLRSRFGNALTRFLFAGITGVKLADTQTGLRAFPRALLPELLTLHGKRYEYEMAVLVHLCRSGFPIEVPIEAVYFAGNRGSHFHPLLDSLRIGWALLRASRE